MSVHGSLVSEAHAQLQFKGSRNEPRIGESKFRLRYYYSPLDGKLVYCSETLIFCSIYQLNIRWCPFIHRGKGSGAKSVST